MQDGSTLTMPIHLHARLATILQKARAPSTNEKTNRMLRQLMAITPPVLPMNTHERLIRAAESVLLKGGRDGGSRCQNAVYDFKRAVQFWHNVALSPAIENNLESPLANEIMLGLRNSAPKPAPKNSAYYKDAEHGHLAFPLSYFLRCVTLADSKLAKGRGDKSYRIGLQRDLMVMILLFALTRRYDECKHATFASFVDLGVGRGINWIIDQMKNAQRERTVIPIPEKTSYGLDICPRLRNFLAIAPKDGRLFRPTANAQGRPGHIWEPATVKDTNGKIWTSKYAGGAWNEQFKVLLAEAVPEIDARIYSAHALRVGGITLGSESGITLEQLSRCAAHKCLDTTKGYLRPGLDERRDVFASMGSGLRGLTK